MCYAASQSRTRGSEHTCIHKSLRRKRVTSSAERLTARMMTLVSDLITLSEAMLAHAECGDWESVAQADRRRRHDLEKLFADCQGSALSALTSELSYIVELDQRIMAAIRGARDEHIATLRAVKDGRRMQRAYKQAG